MRILFKTSYLDDIRLFQHSGQVFWYGLLAVLLLIAPFMLGDFYVGEFSYVFILAIAGVGLMLLLGFTGLASLGHGAFMAIGAYTNTYLITKGVPFLISFPMAGVVAMLAGIAIAIPANRMTGIYLAIATLAFSQIVEQLIIRWELVTRGFQGMPVPPPELLGHTLSRPWEFYYLCLFVLVVIVFAAINLTRSPTGRAMVAIRDFGDLRPEPRRQPGAVQDHRLRAQRRESRALEARFSHTRCDSSHRMRSTSYYPSSCCSWWSSAGWARFMVRSSVPFSSAVCHRPSRSCATTFQPRSPARPGSSLACSAS